MKKASENVIIIDEKDENNHKKQWKFDKDKEKVLDTLFEKKFSKDSKQFNQWFNQEFEKANIRSEDQSNGYGDWLKSNEDIEEEKHISQAFIGEEFEIDIKGKYTAPDGTKVLMGLYTLFMVLIYRQTMLILFLSLLEQVFYFT